MEIVLIRHGRTASNEARRYLGRADEPLSPDGRNQARALHLSGIPHAERVYSSPLKRCLETAEIVFPGCAPIAVPEFVEIDFGRFEGRTHDQLTAEEPAYTAWLDSRGEGEIPGGETQAQLRTRVRTGFLRVAAETDCLKRIAVVVHSGVIMAIISEFARPKRNFYDCFIGNCQTVICDWDGSFLTVKGGDL
ncbi:MAG: histidine phosphatase family protein, partial [Pyramidobacter sp.]|nr:histidine phosphatase family protein [Pyramidobacter sp.]